MTSITIDGRGSDPGEAVQDLWRRAGPLLGEGYVPITEVEIVDAKSKRVVEHFVVKEEDVAAHLQPKSGGPRAKEHKPPTPHEYPFLARLTLEG